MTLSPEIISGFIVALTALMIALATWLRSRAKPSEPKDKAPFTRPTLVALDDKSSALIEAAITATQQLTGTISGLSDSLVEHRREVVEHARELRRKD